MLEPDSAALNLDLVNIFSYPHDPQDHGYLCLLEMSLEAKSWLVAAGLLQFWTLFFLS